MNQDPLGIQGLRIKYERKIEVIFEFIYLITFCMNVYNVKCTYCHPFVIQLLELIMKSLIVKCCGHVENVNNVVWFGY